MFLIGSLIFSIIPLLIILFSEVKRVNIEFDNISKQKKYE